MGDIRERLDAALASATVVREEDDTEAEVQTGFPGEVVLCLSDVQAGRLADALTSRWPDPYERSALLAEPVETSRLSAEQRTIVERARGWMFGMGDRDPDRRYMAGLVAVLDFHFPDRLSSADTGDATGPADKEGPDER